MHVYEKAVADAVNQIAGRDIYFRASEIMALPDDTAAEIVGTLLSWACCGQNTLPITIARECLTQFPAEWVSQRIRQTYTRFIDIADDWEYRRLLEVCELISRDLLRWAVALNEASTNPDIAEAVNDYKE